MYVKLNNTLDREAETKNRDNWKHMFGGDFFKGLPKFVIFTPLKKMHLKTNVNFDKQNIKYALK